MKAKIDGKIRDTLVMDNLIVREDIWHNTFNNVYYDRRDGKLFQHSCDNLDRISLKEMIPEDIDKDSLSVNEIGKLIDWGILQEIDRIKEGILKYKQMGSQYWFSIVDGKDNVLISSTMDKDKLVSLARDNKIKLIGQVEDIDGKFRYSRDILSSGHRADSLEDAIFKLIYS